MTTRTDYEHMKIRKGNSCKFCCFWNEELHECARPEDADVYLADRDADRCADDELIYEFDD